MPLIGRIAAFCDAIREKDSWETKILDEKKKLGIKWAQEAELLQSDPSTQGESEYNDADKQVLEALWELEVEAKRIIYHDYTLAIGPNSPQRAPRTYDWGKLHAQAVNAYKYLKASKHGAFTAELAENVGIFVSDDVVPAVVHSALKVELDSLANIEPRDFHPGTGGKVQDLIHPSLYPYVLNTTPLNSGARDHPELKGEETFDSELITVAAFENLNNLDYRSRFAWLPSIFHVSSDGTSVEIRSYINGLGPRERHPELYKVLEEVFLVVLPLLEKTVNHNYVHEDSPSAVRWKERRDLRGEYDPRILRTAWEELEARQKKEKEKSKAEKEAYKRSLLQEAQEENSLYESFVTLPINDGGIASSFVGKDLQVIVKAANYVLKPGEEYEGSWHIEGMPHERIIASAIYYYDTDEAIVDNGLGFRRLRVEGSDFPHYFDYRHEDFNYKLVDKFPDDNERDDSIYENQEQDVPSDWEGWGSEDIPRNVKLGTVPTTNFKHGVERKGSATGRIITFPNWVQHKVEGVRNLAPEGSVVAHRKILCFFLVDDASPELETDTGLQIIEYPGLGYRFRPHSVLTTADVPYQARGCNFATLHFVLPLVCQSLIGKTLPGEIVELIINAGDDPADKAEFKDHNGALGMSWKAAEERRRAVMTDRRATASKDEEEFSQAYSLCEH